MIPKPELPDSALTVYTAYNECMKREDYRSVSISDITGD